MAILVESACSSVIARSVVILAGAVVGINQVHGDQATRQVKNEAAAVDRARQILGSTNQKEAGNDLVNLVTLEQDNTPFLHERITGRPVWRVEIARWSFNLPSAPGMKNRYERRAEVLVDPQTGTLLSLQTQWPVDAGARVPEPTAQTAERQLESAGGERYLRFPDENPPIGLLEALDSVQRGGGTPLTAKQIIAQCVVRGTRYKEPALVWAITLRGVFPVRTPPGWPQDDRYEYRYLVDATTGKLILISNLPRHEPDASDLP